MNHYRIANMKTISWQDYAVSALHAFTIATLTICMSIVVFGGLKLIGLSTYDAWRLMLVVAIISGILAILMVMDDHPVAERLTMKVRKCCETFCRR